MESKSPEIKNEDKPKEEPKEKKYSPQDFVDGYKELCDRTGFRLAITPAFVRRDDGTFSIVLNTSVEKQPILPLTGKT